MTAGIILAAVLTFGALA